MNLWLRVLLYYIATLFFTVLIAGIQQESGFITPETVILPQLAPGLAALLLLFVFKKERFGLTFSFEGVLLGNVFWVILVPLLVLCGIFFAYNLLVQPLVPHRVTLSQFPLILAGMFLGAIGEEIGWRGYAQRAISEGKNLIIAPLVVGVLWGLWHIGNYQYGVVYVAYFLLFSTGASGVMGYVLGPTRYNVVLAAIFHVVLNCGYFTMKAALPDVRFTLVSGVIWMVAWGLIAFLMRQRVK